MARRPAAAVGEPVRIRRRQRRRHHYRAPGRALSHEQAFTVGLTNPVTGRVPEGIWRRSLNRLGDCVSRCRCTASVFYDPDDPGLRCWNCGQVPIRPPLLQLPGGTVVLSDGASITSHHLHRDRNHDTVIGMVEAHPTKPGEVVLRNVGPDNWIMT